jgi:hypothetical protein
MYFISYLAIFPREDLPSNPQHPASGFQAACVPCDASLHRNPSKAFAFSGYGTPVQILHFFPILQFFNIERFIHYQEFFPQGGFEPPQADPEHEQHGE